ncbi:MAG: hypothetical protein FDZ75_08625 [Actinobacteria bacterium]|nr:MAG: hypothetical protein FDZ75_08625 [Actinomycetota bacterium]
MAWSRDTTAAPDAIPDTTSNSWSEALPEGTWYLNVKTQDAAGNWSQPIALGPVIMDNPPSIVSRYPAQGARNAPFSSSFPAWATLSEDVATLTVSVRWHRYDTTTWTGPLTPDYRYDSSSRTIYIDPWIFHTEWMEYPQMSIIEVTITATDTFGVKSAGYVWSWDTVDPLKL